MSITSLMSTLIATSEEGFPRKLLGFNVAIGFELSEEDSEKTAAITSQTSVGFNRKGCCSLINIF